jgi:hypothetical protein
MIVSGQQDELVLNRQAGDPQIVRRDRRAGKTQLHEQTSVDVSGFPVRVEDVHTSQEQKTQEQCLIVCATPLVAAQESSFDLSQGDERDPEFRRLFHHGNDSGLAAKRVR